MADRHAGSTDSTPVAAPQSQTAVAVLEALHSSEHGLERQEVSVRLERYGPNSLPRGKPPGLLRIFMRQFASPLIYVLGVAALVSLLIHESSDALFIAAVLLVNAIIGTVQEFSAQRAADALQRLVVTRCRVLRVGEIYEIDAEELVPGDIVLLESGDRVPADLRLLQSRDLEIDESLLTGESENVLKHAEQILPADSPLGDRVNMAFAGTLVSRGRGRGVVVATGLGTELGRIAEAVLGRPPTKPPLLLKMERFTHTVAAVVALAALLMGGVALGRGMPLEEIFLLAVALAVSAIPEGLPVALTVALAISMRRMARRHVIVRRLVAVESLGSCTFIATDKTGTLTVNQLTVQRLLFAGEPPWEVTGEGLKPEGVILTPRGTPDPAQEALLEQLCRAAVLANEGLLARRDDDWTRQGDAVDIALLVMAHKAGIIQAETRQAFPELASLPFESERMFAASLNQVDGRSLAFVKGALERLLPMCSQMATPEGPRPLDAELLERQARELASQGFRVIALASGPVELGEGEVFSEEHLRELLLIGLVGMIDPLRPEAKAAVTACRRAGIEVGMITGDHPATALAIARELELAQDARQVVTGSELRQTEDDPQQLDRLVRRSRVFARVEPQQKLDIVRSLQRSGHFVAVSGDGANDAPALRAAQVGVAMGESGTDVARQTADLIITDDNFASLVAGVEEGRIAYGNVRKVIFLLISTGAAELVLFTLALFTGLPLPLLAVQLLWLNLVTNGIQDVALAFEPGEGDELNRPPRSPREPVFNRLMVERVLLSAAVIGGLAFLLFQWLLAQGYSVDEARNGTLLLMVLFENVHVFNSRSETRSLFRHSPLRNPLLLFGTLTAQLIHIGAMYTPGIREILRIQPVSPQHWLQLLGLTLSVLVVMELHKWLRRWR
ncbi:HAD-IC family P-type ATPase [Thiohalobacter sp. IOR34]|uniref:cation-translocating P-type ATPase n=1 Tax=Thiohalobacter sp. IOR34 TaxID=3057176 RepID=UPI0025B2256E|nr:HAD-IC family P-type ATPase [Thiohalobacter sp. IOR34]WJW74324.1 HAD-IC family P-type ATPase [Thiohalobacter sp. IOR34]